MNRFLSIILLFSIYSNCIESFKFKIENTNEMNNSSSSELSDSIYIVINYLKNISPGVLKLSKQSIQNFLDGYEIPEDQVNSRMNKINGRERYVYFYKDDIDKVMGSFSCDDNKKGIRSKIYQYKHDLKTSQYLAHPYQEQFNVVIQGRCEFEEKGVMYDYGDVCPPNYSIEDVPMPIWIPRIIEIKMPQKMV